MRQTGRTTKNLIKLAHHASQSVDKYYFISPNSEMSKIAFNMFLKMFSECIIDQTHRAHLSVVLHGGSSIMFVFESFVNDEMYLGATPRKYICDHDTYVTSHHFIFSNKDISNV